MSLERTSGRAAGARRMGDGAGPSGARTAPWIAWAVGALAATFGGLFLVLLAVNSRAPEVSTYEYWGAEAVTAIVFPAVGALIVSRYSRHLLGWLFCLMGLSSGLAGFASQYATYALIVEPGSLPAAVTAAWLGSWVGTPGFLLVALVPLLFPGGRPPSSRWWPVAWIALGVIVAATVSFALMPGPLEGPPSVDNPLGMEGARGAFDAILAVGAPILGLALLVGIASLVVRYRRSPYEERQQLKWFTYAAVLIPFILLGNTIFPDLAWLIGGVGVALMPLAIGVAVLRHRLYDIDLVINRTLVYAGLTACIVGVYVLVVGYFGALFQTEDNLLISLVAAGLVAVLFAPLKERLQRGVDRLTYGERKDPYGVLSRLGARLEGSLAPEAVLPTVVQTVRESLKLPYAAVELEDHGGSPVAESGRPAPDPLRLPLVHRGEKVGELLLTPRPGERGFSAADRKLLEDLARQAGAAAHAVRLTHDLKRSRERLVATREEERRRLRRDLHDGLGPMLGSLALKLDVADDLVEGNPARARELLRGLKEQSQEAVTDVRRLVHALRPPALDELGLVGAIREQAARYEHGGLAISVKASGLPQELPAAVEVAAYRIVQEALTNVARHAGASRCELRLDFDEVSHTLTLEVTDDGRGLPEERRSGVGLYSMRERAAELGGVCVVEAAPEGGTRVRAELPLGGSDNQNSDVLAPEHDG